MAYRTVELYIIEPKAATNLVTNPSFETATTGYTAVGASSSIARTASYQRRGVYGLDITPTSAALSGVYFGTVALTSGTTYNFSADVKDVDGQSFSLYIADTSAVAKATTTWTGDGHWKRKSVSWACDSTASYRLYLTRASVASTTHFYTDGWQAESGAESTYFDGDSKGWQRTRNDYWWNGTPHASTSVRSSRTRSGGTMLRLRDFGSIIGIIGLGMGALTNNFIPTSGDGAYYTNTRAVTRDFSVIFQFTGNGYTDIFADRAELIDALKPDNVPDNEPVTLRYLLIDENGNPKSDALHIAALYSGGLEGDWSNPEHKQVYDRAVMNFTTHLPFIAVDGTQGSSLTTNASVTNFSNIGYRDTDGTWYAMGTGADNIVYKIVIGPDGSIYAGGAFTAMGGVASTGYIARWDGAAWNALDTGLNGIVYTMAFDANGLLYVGGEFTNAGGDANADYIATWNGSAWGALGATPLGGRVEAIAIGPDGTVYAGGAFLNAGGVAEADTIAKWDGSSWSAMATGTNSTVKNIVVAPNGDVYASGEFTSVSGVSNTAYIARWDGAAWNALSATAPNAAVLAMDIAPDGTLYIGGLFTTAGGLTVNYAAKWNGTAFSALGSGMGGGGGSPYVYNIHVDKYTGNAYLSGAFTTADGLSLPSGNAVWNGYNFFTFDVSVGATTFYELTTDISGRIYVGGYWSATTTTGTTGAITTASNGSARAYPIVKLTGPGTVWNITNNTTGASIYLDGLTLLGGEKVTLDLRPGKLSLTSTTRGNIINYITPGTDLDWFLISGSNSITLYMTGTDGNSAATIHWTPSYWGVEGTIR